MVDGSHTITELVFSPHGIWPPMTTMVCPPEPFSLPLSMVTQAWYCHPLPKSGDHWLVEFHCNCDDNDDDDDDKELMISRPDISICSCIVMVLAILPCACSLFFGVLSFMLHVACGYSRTCTLSSSKATYGERGVGPARREDCCPRVNAIPVELVHPGSGYTPALASTNSSIVVIIYW